VTANATLEDRPGQPLTLEADLDLPLSRWLWLVKWFLAIPHFVVLFFLFIAYLVLTVVAGFAILFTGRYPRGIFNFNLGVLRWAWRVQCYTYGALSTDRYPPFTLADVPDYPARLNVAYPERLSRGLVLVKWWLLALPQYLIVSIISGGWGWHFGLVGILTLIAGVVLLFRSEYLRDIFPLVIGLNRWAMRVTVYASLMTDQYPPFRLDQGGHELTGIIPPTG
jgi:Domain of unknown function (DUF4389)